MKREEFIEKWGASMGHGFTNEELSADLNSLSLPPAEGAEDDDEIILGEPDKLNLQWSGYGVLGNCKQRQQPTSEGAEEILAKGRILMYDNIIVDPIMLPEGIYATKELRIYLPETTIEHLMETGKSFRDKTQTQWLPDSYFDNLSKCELIDVDVVRDATLHAQKIADKMVEEKCAKCKHRGLPDSINEALNSGDGVYRP